MVASFDLCEPDKFLNHVCGLVVGDSEIVKSTISRVASGNQASRHLDLGFNLLKPTVA